MAPLTKIFGLAGVYLPYAGAKILGLSIFFGWAAVKYRQMVSTPELLMKAY